MLPSIASVLLATALAATTQKTSSWLRVIQINDVYDLDHFPRLKTLVDKKLHELRWGQQGPCPPDHREAIVVCSGDFLSPSILSSLDHGASMVDTLNAVGLTHACFGNHEADVPDEALRQRIAKQSNFEWVNTNMRQLDEKLSVDTPEYAVIDVGGRYRSGGGSGSEEGEGGRDSSYSRRKKVALLGLLTADPSLYRPGAFSGATIDPVVEATSALLGKLDSTVDLIVPLTHQGIQEDRDFCKRFEGKFPVVCGGHDHEVYDETVAGNRIIKTGMDAVNAAVIDIQWQGDVEKESITVNVEMLPTSEFDPDPDLSLRVKGHQKVLVELERARLFCIQDWMDDYDKDNDVFSTFNNRLGPSTGTTAIATMLRMGMRAQCCIVNAGCIRANKVYEDETYFTWSDLKAEVPYSTGMTACYIPGKILEATIAHSRQGTRRDPPEALGGYLHCCSNIKFKDATDRIELIRGEKFDPKRLYLTALPTLLLGGLDNLIPLLEWVQTQGGTLNGDEESAIPAKMVLVEVFAALLWLQLGSFDEIDTDKDGILKRDEVKERVLAVYGHDAVANLVVDSIFSVADINNDGTITPLDMMIVQFCATDIVDHICTEDELKAMKDVAAKVLGMDPTHDDVKRMVEQIRDAMDLADDGLIHRDEAMKALGDFDDNERKFLV